MKIRIECKATKGDVWATLSITETGSCKAFYLDTEIKSMDTEFVRRLDYRGTSNDNHTYYLNRSALADRHHPMVTRVEELTNHLIDRNNALLNEYSEEHFIVNCEG